MEERYNTHFSRPIYVAAFVLLLLFGVAGRIMSSLFDESFQWTSLYIALGMMLLIALLGVISRIGEKALIKSNSKDIQVRQEQEKLVQRKELALENLASAKKKIVKWRRIISFYAFLLFVSANAIMLLLGICKIWILALFAVTPLFFFVVLISEQRLIPYYTEFNFNDYVNRADYPLIYAVADKAAKTVGVYGEIRIVFINDCNAAIGRIKNVISLQLGVVLLDVLTEDELYQVLLHEFGHMSKEGQIGKKEDDLHSKIETLRSLQTKARVLIGSLFALPDVIFAKEFYYYRITASQALEIIADKLEKKHGTPQTAINALAKIDYYGLFTKELDFAPEPFYAPETMRSDVSSSNIKRFRKAISERSALWNQILKNEIQPRSASHPIFRARMESMGITDFTVTLPDEASDYRKECKNATVKCDKILYDHLVENYAEARKEHYLKHVDVINSWERKGKPLTDESSRSIIEALLNLQRFDEAEALCDEIINNNKNRAATAHSRFTKGMLHLRSYQRDGIDLIYEAIDINSNYVDSGLTAIGEFCCQMGLQKELDEYRERAVTLAQTQVDENSKLSELLPTDDLVEDDIDKEMLESILNYFESIGENSISRIYLVKKVINESFFGSCFIIRFKDGTPIPVVNRVMDKIFNHLDTHESERHFSLFIYGVQYAPVVAKVENSCVWDIADKM
ncbi:MAG: hypothetical protein IIW39_00980 [Clostridia bacterium]|nr:hypothetical protein [Clostridia bacterium]